MLDNSRIWDLFAHPDSMYAKPLVRRILLAFGFYFLVLILLSADFLPDKISLTVGEVSDRDIIAPRTVSYVDAVKTQKLEGEVLSSIASVYDLDGNVLAKAEESITGIFDVARRIHLEGKTLREDERVKRLAAEAPIPLSAPMVTALSHLEETDLAKAESLSRTLLRKYYQRGVRDDDLDLSRRHIVLEVEELRLGDHLEPVVAGICQTLLRPNYLLNVRETDKRKQSALVNIDPVRVTVKKGQMLVRTGEVVSQEQVQAMEELGLQAGHFSEVRILGLAVFVLIVLALLVGYLYKFCRHVYDSERYLLLLGAIMVSTLLMAKGAHYYSDFASPIAMAALLTAILVNVRLGFMVGVAMTMFFGVVVEHNLRPVVMALIGSTVGVYGVSRMTHGYSLTKTGLMLAVVNLLVNASTGLLEQVKTTQLLLQSAQGILGGVGAAIISIGLLPYFEHAFKVTTPIKILELAQPNHPLLQRLLLEAPGTYHHSVLVGNLAETAADTIGADPVIARVGAYYHDIGKIKRPYFFVENQITTDNPHDKIAPSLSALIVISHIKDGVELCRDYQVPKVISDVVEQHHGTTLVSYFYNRATETEHGDCLVEADFRYEGPKPQTKEAALVMLADACEASVRAIGNPNANRIEATVRRMIRERLHDGQLDECELTLRDLNVIGDVYIRILNSMFHKRIDYPEPLKDLERRRTQNGSGNKQCPEPTGNTGSV